MLANEVKIAGETVPKQRFGMASVHDENKTLQVMSCYQSKEERFWKEH